MKVIVDELWCKGCEICINICPKNVFTLSSKRSKRGYLIAKATNIDQCIGCRLCEKMCPDCCINVENRGDKK